MKKHIWRLPVEVPYVPKGRRWWFALYAILSGAYSYTVLYIVARFVGNIVRNFSPEWGFVPEIAVALLIFRSRIRSLVNFMKFLYLDKKDRLAAWFAPARSIGVGVAALILLALPMRRESSIGKFLLEPAHLAVLHARIPGVLTQVNVQEGQSVAAGNWLANLQNLPLRSDYESAKASFTTASDQAKAAALHYADYGAAIKERERLASHFQQLSQMDSALQLTSPIAGIVLTPRVQDQLGAYFTEGGPVLEVADLSTMRARIYVSEFDLYKVRNRAEARLQVAGIAKTWPARIASITARPTELDRALVENVELEGANAPHYYVVDLIVENSDALLKPGMRGVARIYGERRSLLGLGWEATANFFGRKVW